MCIRDRSHVVQHFFGKHNISQLQHPPYSPDMAPCDFFLFPKIKNQSKGRTFQGIEEIKENAMRELGALTEEDVYKRQTNCCCKECLQTVI